MTNIQTSLLLIFTLFSCSTPMEERTEEVLTLQAENYIPELSETLVELSGLMSYDDILWGFNDSGGENKLYGFNKSGNIIHEVELEESNNQDWESITHDSINIYVGDFGNNMGNRKNLRIYKVNKNALSKKEKQKVGVENIAFSYTEQNVYNFSNQSTPFDCEAMVAFKNQLYLFSKNWRDRTTCLYQIPTESGDYKIAPSDTFNVEALVTGADISPDKKTLALVGYENYRSYIWLFSDFPGDRFFEGNSQTIYLQGIEGAQTEGICFLSNDSILISCEKTITHDQQVFLFDLNKLNDGAH